MKINLRSNNLIHEKMTKLSRAFEEDRQLTRNLANTSDASHIVVPWCLELGSYSK